MGSGSLLTFWFGYRYFAKRLRDHGYPDAWLARAFIWIVIASVVGARAVHVAANLRAPRAIWRTRATFSRSGTGGCPASADFSAECRPGSSAPGAGARSYASQ